MTERNENELNDKVQLKKEEIDYEIDDSNVIEHDVVDDDVLENEDVATNQSAPPLAPERNTSALIAPWVITAIAIIALVIVLVRNPSGGTMNEVVAKMDGITLKTSDLYAEMTSQMSIDQQISLVDNAAQNKMIDLESTKAGIVVTDDTVNQEIENIKKSNNLATDEDLTAALQQSGMTLDLFKERVKQDIKLKKLFESQNPVSDADLKAYFDKNKETFATTPKEVKASHILLPTKAEADAVLAELKAGKDFATLAKQKSQDTGSNANGGDLGFFPRGQLNTEFETAAFALTKGQMSDVVQSPNGFHIIKVTDIKEAVIPTYDEVKDKVKDAYFNEKLQTEAQPWIDKMKADRNYKNLLVKDPLPTASASASPSASPAAQ
jgi:foldase protein PrsA